MGKDTKIEWAGSTYNPWSGCRKVSAGCKYCYMFRGKERWGQDPNIVVKSKKMRVPFTFKEPSLIFVCSWSDFFIRDADKWRDEVWSIIRRTPDHIYQILTKRPERIEKCLPDDWGDGYDNVWLGVTVENQEQYIKRMDILDGIKAKVKFISAEPLLENIDLEAHRNHGYINTDKPKIDWVIVGGESGFTTGKYKFRKCDISWIRNIVKQCEKLDTPVFVKQLGSYNGTGKGAGKGHAFSDIDKFPEDLKIRMMPKVFKNNVNFQYNEITL